MNLIVGTDLYYMETIMFKARDDVPSGEVIWIQLATIFSTLLKNNLDYWWIHESAVVVEVNKYLCMDI